MWRKKKEVGRKNLGRRKKWEGEGRKERIKRNKHTPTQREKRSGSSSRSSKKNIDLILFFSFFLKRRLEIFIIIFI